MKKICHWLGTWSSIFICGTVPVLSVPRTNVVITGTTVASGWERREGKPSSSCPESHPWAISLGTVCCQRFHHKADMNLRLEWNDPPTACWNSEWISCPSLDAFGRLCRTNNNFVDPILCPQTHPIQMANGCCQNYRRTPECGGGLITPNDDLNCCFNNTVFQASLCSIFKTQCLAPHPEDANTYCPRNPTHRRYTPEKDIAFIASPGPVPYKTGRDNCVNMNGQLLPWEPDTITGVVEFLRNNSLSQDYATAHTYMSGPRLKDATKFCNTLAKCQGNIEDRYSSETLNLAEKLAGLNTTFDVSKKNLDSLALRMSLENPISLRVVQIVVTTGSGGYVCFIPCLV